MIQDQDTIKKKAQVFFDNSISVHVQKKSGEWLNGYISEVSSDFFMLNERLKGDLPVFFLEIESIEKYVLPSEAKG